MLIPVLFSVLSLLQAALPFEQECFQHQLGVEIAVD
jgi:hypothetical protein